MRYALPAPWFLLELTFVDACILVFDHFLGTLARLRLNAGLYLMPSYALPWCSYAMQREKVGKESRFTTRLHGLLRKGNCPQERKMQLLGKHAMYSGPHGLLI